MVDKQAVDAFIERMEETYHPLQTYADKARATLYKMLKSEFPDDQAPRIFALAKDMYRSHATTRSNIDSARRDLEEISSDLGRIAEGIKTMTNAYASSVEEIVLAGEHLSDAAQAQHDAGTELLGAAVRLQDAAQRIQEKKREDADLFAPSKKRYEN